MKQVWPADYCVRTPLINCLAKVSVTRRACVTAKQRWPCSVGLSFSSPALFVVQHLQLLPQKRALPHHPPPSMDPPPPSKPRITQQPGQPIRRLVQAPERALGLNRPIWSSSLILWVPWSWLPMSLSELFMDERLFATEVWFSFVPLSYRGWRRHIWLFYY